MGRDCALEEGVGGHTPELLVSQEKCWHGCMCCLDASTSMCRKSAKLRCSSERPVSQLGETGGKLE